MTASQTKDECPMKGRHMSAMHLAACPVCNPNKTAPELNAAAGEARSSKSVTSILNTMAERFTSGNSIPVERTHITRKEWDAVLAELMQPVETTGSIGTTVTLTAEEFQSLMATKEKLASDLADADRINSESVNRLCALEAEIADEISHMNEANAVLTARVKRLRKRIGRAHDVLAAALSEDAMGESSIPIRKRSKGDGIDLTKSSKIAELPL